MGDGTDNVRVLHVDDDEEFLLTASRRLEGADDRLSVETESDPVAALDRLDGVDCVVSDYQMPQLDGLRFYEAVGEERPDLPFLLFTGEGSADVAVDAFEAGVTDYVRKRIGAAQYTLLANRVRNAVDRADAERALEACGEGDGERESTGSDASPADWYRSVVETMQEGVYVIGGDHEFRFFDHWVGEAEPGSAADWTGRRLPHLAESGVLSEAEVEAVAAGIDAILEGEADEVRVELDPAVPADAGVVELRLTPMRVDGELVALGTTRDVSDRIERETQLRRTTERYRTLIDNFPNGGVFTFDKDLTHTLAGGEELEAVGLTAEDIVGSTPSELIPEDVAAELETNFRAALDGEHRSFEQTYQSNHYQVHTLPVGEEPVTTGMAVSQNVTERKEHRRELERQNERLEEFTSVVSHDLRNPLTVLKSALDLVEETGEAEHFKRGRRAVERMERLVSDLRALARQGDRVTDLEPVALADVARAGWGTVETGDARLTVESDVVVLADEGRLRQLFENLFRNAVEHGSTSPASQAQQDAVEHGSTGQGDVEPSADGVRVTVGDTDDGGFYVGDDGPGIAPDRRERVFDSGYSTTDEGTGFGLAIVSEIASAHGWTIDLAESEDGGARFEVIGVDHPE